MYSINWQTKLFHKLIENNYSDIIRSISLKRTELCKNSCCISVPYWYAKRIRVAYQ